MKTKSTILAVDDNHINLNILEEILEDYNTITCTNAKDALKILKKEPIDLILLDIMMPELNGFDACELIKQDKELQLIPLIFLSAKEQISDIQKGFALGAVDYVTKPFNYIELLSRIDTHLRLRSYEKNLEKKIKEEVEKNKLNEQLMFQKNKQSEIGELLMHISHQWKQPLSEISSINMYNTSKLNLQDHMDKQELLENFNKISEILRFMSDTILTFTNFYEPNAYKETFDTSSIVSMAVNMMNATFYYESIEVEVIKKNVANIYGNKNECSQVILSLLSNAKDIFKQRDIQNPKIVITLDKNKEGKSLIQIKDNAGGIEADIMKNVFLPFVSKKGSTGMGLYMAKSICEKHQGSITVQNDNEGAVFTIIL